MEIITKLAPLALSYIMFSLGLQCKLSNFKKVLAKPKNLFIGLFSQVIVLPIIGLLFAYFAPVEAQYKIGIILITCVPGAVTSNVLTKIVKGNIHLSMIMTVTASIISFISIPLILTKIAPFLGLIKIIKFDLTFTKASLFLFFVSSVPVLFGALINNKFSNFAKSATPFFNKSSTVVFIAFVLLAWHSEFERSLEGYKELFWVLIMLLSSVIICINILLKVLKTNVRDSRTIVIEVFIQNGAMAIIVGSSIFGFNSGYLLMAAIYGLFQYKAFLIWYLIDKRINRVV